MSSPASRIRAASSASWLIGQPSAHPSWASSVLRRQTPFAGHQQPNARFSHQGRQELAELTLFAWILGRNHQSSHRILSTNDLQTREVPYVGHSGPTKTHSRRGYDVNRILMLLCF